MWSPAGKDKSFYHVRTGGLRNVRPLRPGPPAAKTRILILNSYHYGYLWSDSVVDGARGVLYSKLNKPEIYVEFMDTKRTSNPKHLDLLYQSYKLKCKNTRFDAILSSDDSALAFLPAHADEIFPDTPVVFCGVNNYDANAVAHHRWFTGLAGKLDVQATRNIALHLQPHVDYVISDDTLTGLVTDILSWWISTR